MRVFSITVTRNEADRYLAEVLDTLAGFVDHRFVYDDQSTDATVDLAIAAGCEVWSRGDGTPSFLEHEGAFRQAAWRVFETTMTPAPEDWVLSVDADEFLATAHDRATVLRDIAATAGDRYSATIRIPEVFGADGDGCPLIRTDGFWNTIAARRFFRYEPGGHFRDKAMGCGSEPTYVNAHPTIAKLDDPVLLHYGYAAEADRRTKHTRYTTLADHGHSSTHVQSILSRQTLIRWDGPR